MIPAPSELRPCPRRCGALVLWTRTAAGRPMAVDPHPDPKGNQACYRVDYRTWVSRSLDGADARPLAPHEHRFVPHVATCTPPAPKPVQPALPGLATVTRLDTHRRRKKQQR